jgi:hypothetical protein
VISRIDILVSFVGCFALVWLLRGVKILLRCGISLIEKLIHHGILAHGVTDLLSQILLTGMYCTQTILLLRLSSKFIHVPF